MRTRDCLVVGVGLDHRRLTRDSRVVDTENLGGWAVGEGLRSRRRPCSGNEHTRLHTIAAAAPATMYVSERTKHLIIKLLRRRRRTQKMIKEATRRRTKYRRKVGSKKALSREEGVSGWRIESTKGPNGPCNNRCKAQLRLVAKERLERKKRNYIPAGTSL